MTKVFVHGNPETAAIWKPLIAELAHRGISDVVTLSPPGFGSPTPEGWGATRIEYREWLAEQLRIFSEPVDLVGHDWGAGHTYGVITEYPHLVRSWAADCAGLLHKDYVWHDAAQSWQTPDVGETMVNGMVELDDATFIEAFAALGMGQEIAGEVKKAINSEMARCILALYRDAAQPVMSELGKEFGAVKPKNGLVIVAEEDHYAGPLSSHEEIARSLNASVAHIPKCGHWWMIENPVLGADILISHWKSL